MVKTHWNLPATVTFPSVTLVDIPNARAAPIDYPYYVTATVSCSMP